MFIHSRIQLHQLIPSVLTCIVARTIGERNNDEHWDLRSLSAKLVASMCTKYRSHKNLQVRMIFIGSCLLTPTTTPDPSEQDHAWGTVGY